MTALPPSDFVSIGFSPELFDEFVDIVFTPEIFLPLCEVFSPLMYNFAKIFKQMALKIARLQCV